MGVLLQETEGNIKEDGNDPTSPPVPIPPPLPGSDFRKDRSPLDGTPWQHNVQAQQLLDPMPKPSKPMMGLVWQKVNMTELVGELVLETCFEVR